MRWGPGAGPAVRRLLRAGGAAAALTLAACSAGPDHERLGDRRYAERSFIDALAEYRLAMRQPSPSPELRAKFAAAALHVGALAEAVAAYRDLARADPASQEDAGDGLAHAARLAIDARDVAALGQAVAALRQLQPDRVLGRVASALGASYEPGGRPGDALDILLQGAAVSAPGTADSLLVLYGDLNVQLTQLDAAQRAYESVLRRSPTRSVAQAARAWLVRCAIARGRDALGAGFLDDALAWFGKAIAYGEPDSLVRVAWLLTGDARWAGSDTTRAADAYRRAAAGGGDDDPTTTRANEQLQKLIGGGNR